MALKFKIGDRVKLSKEGEKKYDRQSKGNYGTIIRLNNLGFPFEVKWDHGYTDVYKNEDLEPVVDSSSTYSGKPFLADQVAVHVSTKEQWNTVSSIIGYIWRPEDTWDTHGSDTCINLYKYRFYGRLKFYRSKEYTILTFSEFMKRYGMVSEPSGKLFSVGDTVTPISTSPLKKTPIGNCYTVVELLPEDKMKVRGLMDSGKIAKIAVKKKYFKHAEPEETPDIEEVDVDFEEVILPPVEERKFVPYNAQELIRKYSK